MNRSKGVKEEESLPVAVKNASRLDRDRLTSQQN